MQLEVRHSFILFFATVALDFLFLQLVVGIDLYTIGAETTAKAQILPASVYLALCFAFGWLALRTFPDPMTRVSVPKVDNGKIAWALLGLVSVLILVVAGPVLFSLDPVRRQLAFIDNPWVPRTVIFCLPLAIAAIVLATKKTRIVIALLLLSLFSLSGSRIHVMALLIALIVSFSNHRVKTWHLLIGGAVGLVLLDLLANARTQGANLEGYSVNLIEMFGTGHYSTFDIQTILLEENFRLTLGPSYVLSAFVGPLREVLDLAFQRSSSEFFTYMTDPARYYGDRSLATVGLSGELFMIFGWLGCVIFGGFLFALGWINRAVLYASGASAQMEMILRALFFVYIFLLLRSDMWIFFVYFWLQLPVMVGLAFYFRRQSERRARKARKAKNRANRKAFGQASTGS